MTNEEIKQWLESGARATGNDFFAKAYNLITKQEQEIAELKAAKNDWKQRYESLDQRYIALVASSVECMDKKVKKAKTDVLNELKLLSIYDFNYMDSYVLVDDIDKMIAEVEQCRR